MKIIIRQLCFLFALFFFILSVFFVEARSQQQEKPLPQAIVDSLVHDFGNIFKGEVLNHVFRINNIGDAPLELSETRKLIGLAQPVLWQRSRLDGDFKAAPVRASLSAPS